MQQDGQTQEGYSELKLDWHMPVEKWDGFRLDDYIIWVRETYGVEEANKLFTYADQYRAVKDVANSVEPQSPKSQYISHLAHTMIHTKEVMAANIMKKMWGMSDDDAKTNT